MSELKPCPFCGSTSIDPKGVACFKKEHRTDGNTWDNHTPDMIEHHPACDDCGASTNGEWNTRPAQAEAIKALEEKMQEVLRQNKNLRQVLKGKQKHLDHLLRKKRDAALKEGR